MPSLALLIVAIALAVGFSTTGVDQASAAACADFPNQAAAQRAANTRDADGDGVYCETLPCPCLGKSGGASSGGGSTTPSRTGRLGRFARLPVTVTSVVDGDTLRIRTKGGVNTTMRVIGIDTPETKKPGVPVECGGKEATAMMMRLAQGKSGVIVADPTQDSVDRYGRALGYIEVGGKDLGLALVRAGRADVYVYGGVPFTRVARYRAAQARAKAQVLGVFATCQGDFHSEQ